MPYFDMSIESYSKMASRGRECERGHGRFECEVEEDDSALNMCEDCSAILVDREQQITPRCEAQS